MSEEERFVVEGRAVVARLVVTSTNVIVGAPLLFELQVTNESADDMFIVSSPGGNGASDGFRVTVTGPDGAVPAVPPGFEADNGLRGPVPLRAKGAYLSRLLLADWVTIDRPGRHTITVERTLRLGVGRPIDWASKAVEHPTRLSVTVDVDTPR